MIREEVIARYGRIQVASPGYYAGTAVGVIDPAWEAQGSVNLMQGLTLAIWRMESLSLPPCREPIAAALSAWVRAPDHAPVDIWPAREPDAAGGSDVLRPTQAFAAMRREQA